MNTKRRVKKKGEGEELLSGICLHIANTASLLRKAVEKREGFLFGSDAEKFKASIAVDDFYRLLNSHWKDGSRKREEVVRSAFDQAHKEGMGNGKTWKRERAVKEVEGILLGLRRRLKYLEFLAETEDCKKEKGLPGKLYIALSPEPLYLSDHEVLVLATFLKEVEINMKKMAKEVI